MLHGAVFTKRAPLVAEGKRRLNNDPGDQWIEAGYDFVIDAAG
jgi:hypothetical protein